MLGQVGNFFKGLLTFVQKNGAVTLSLLAVFPNTNTNPNLT
jgi:hypothetical protein